MDDSVAVLVVEDEDDIRNLVALNLRRVGFHDRHMLQRGGVENQLGRFLRDDARHPFFAAHIGDNGQAVQLRPFLPDLEIDGIKRIFRGIEKGKPGGTEACQLARQLASNAAAAAF